MIHNQRGDTIIEVMVAFAVFAMVAVGALTVMNQGTASAQNTLETTLVRQEIDKQAEMLRFLHQAYTSNPNDSTGPSSKFAKIIELTEDAGLSQPSTFGQACTQSLPGDANRRFVLRPDGDTLPSSDIKPIADLNVATSAPYAKVSPAVGSTPITSYGIWVEPVLSNNDQDTNRYIDFHVRACWDSAQGDVSRTLGTIIRLYVPRNIATGTATPVGSVTPVIPSFYRIPGAAASRCEVHTAVEGNDSDRGGNPPTWAPFTPGFINPTPDPAHTCQRPGGMSGSILSCSNYDSEFTPGIAADRAGQYELSISYADSVCGAPGVYMTSSSYEFYVAVYVDNESAARQVLRLRPSSGGVPATSTAVDIGRLNTGSNVKLRWWNNHFVNPGSQDPDFTVQFIDLNRTAL